MRKFFVPLMLVLALGLPAIAEEANPESEGDPDAKSIPEDQVRMQYIFWGDPSGFEKPASIDFPALIECTPEAKKVKKDELDTNDSRYWILMTRAQQHVAEAIRVVGNTEGYDLICQKGYLKKLGIGAKDITTLVKAELLGAEDN